MTPKLLISIVLPRLCDKGEPTELTKYLSKSSAGRDILQACLRFYIANMKSEYSKFKIETDIDIEDYRYDR